MDYDRNDPIVWITLTEYEQGEAKRLGLARQTNNERAHVRNARVSQLSDLDAHIVGAGGELAFARLMNVYPDFSTEPRQGGIDCCVGPYSVDVKATLYPKKPLCAVAHKVALAADMYALMICRFPSYGFCGLASKDSLFHPNRLHKGQYELPQSELRHDLPLVYTDIPFESNRRP